jgi:hypothetical protein
MFDMALSRKGGLAVKYTHAGKRISATPGVVEHGLFSPDLVHDVIIGGRS